MAKPENGDYVKVITQDEEFDGILMPRPEIFDKNIIILKLDSGYNIGIDKAKIKKIELVKKYEPKKAKKHEIKFNKNLPTVLIISCGGTISSKLDYRTGGASADYAAEDFIQMCPELENIANIKTKKAFSLMSEDMNPKAWQKIAEMIHKELKQCDGVIITQGTDTLHFTTYAMSFFLKNLNKPVIFTASQRSIDRGSSDAFMNLICSVTAAAKFDFAGVATCLHGTINDDYCILNRGAKVRKMHTSRRDAFRPLNELPLAKIFTDGRIEITNDNFRKASESKELKTELDNKFEHKVAMITIYPGMDPEIIDFYANKGYKGIVLSATALGHVPTITKGYSLEPYLKKAHENGLAVVIASQTLYGRTNPYVYSNLRKLSITLHCIYVEDMIPEAAYVKLGWALGHTSDIAEVKKMMLKNVAGEINERHEPESFLF
ncbi:MAG: Glu-tRNA(Gln) amidotransferase subunit GatD [Nanoarchaeota archaeon]|nr:Glu-tRNA(Gln) amidotransferase subunit GatD [Nanoarchaeota archaeon]